MIKSILLKHRWIFALKSSLLSQKSFMRENSEAQQILNMRSHLWVSCRHDKGLLSLGAKHFTFSHQRCSQAHIFGRIFMQLKFSSASLRSLAGSVQFCHFAGVVHNSLKLKKFQAFNFL